MLTNLTVATELFHAADETAFADIMIGGHRETWPIRSSRFRLWLRRKYYEATGEAPSAGEVNSALNLLEARAQFDGPLRAVHVAEQKSLRLEMLQNKARASIDPPSAGTGSGNMPAALRNRTGGQGMTCHPSGPISTARQCSSARSR
jgi:hypothetical protein